MGATSMPVRILGHSSWSARLHLQEGSEQNVQTSRTQRPGGSRLCVGGNTCGQRTAGSLQGRRQTSRWADDDALERRKATHLGRHCVCPFAESYIGDSATNADSAAEAAATRKAAKYAGLERTHIFQPVCRRKLRHDERVSIRLFGRAWAENLGDIRRRP